MNSVRRVIRKEIHQPFDLGDGRERGVVVATPGVTAERAVENHWSSWLGEGVRGGVG